MNKILIGVFCLLTVSCGLPSEPDVQPVARTKRIKCPKCNGTGKEQMSGCYKAGLAVATLGFGLLCNEPVECGDCGGKGYIKQIVTDKDGNVVMENPLTHKIVKE